MFNRGTTWIDRFFFSLRILIIILTSLFILFFKKTKKIKNKKLKLKDQMVGMFQIMSLISIQILVIGNH